VKKGDVVQMILGKKQNNQASQFFVETFAPSNIALCKYWGKRNQELNLPMTSSLSISLGELGTITQLKTSDSGYDVVMHNNEQYDLTSPFCKRLLAFLDLFRTISKWHLQIAIQTNIPLAAGLASSASGFASLVKALNQLFHWELKPEELSILARLGSGSACRSICSGFVEWHAGEREDGMDSYGESIPELWPELCVGLLILSCEEKQISSRDAMQCTVETSPFYALWPDKVGEDLFAIKQAIYEKNFHLLGKTMESNAMAMHATMLSSWPPIVYAIPETVVFMKKIWVLRYQGLPVYFTQDAGPNLKLLFLKTHEHLVRVSFPNIEVVQPFAKLDDLPQPA
jgi:diphosphomevalonate decarboxylase